MHHALRTGALYTRGGYIAVRQDAVATLQLPQDISDTIAGRIDALPAGYHDILTMVSLLGDEFRADELAILEPGDQSTTEPALAVAIEQGILRREADRYHFIHALIRRAFASRLSPEHRQRLHLGIAQALERFHENDPNAHALELAYHLLEAGPLADNRLLRRYATQAGNQAFSRFAWSDAARYYEAALSAIQPDRDRAMLHYQAGLAHYRNQDAGPALEHFQEATTYYESVGSTSGLAQALMWLVRVRLTHAAVPMGMLPPYIDELEAVLDSLDSTETSLRGHIMSVLAQAYRPARQPEKAAQLAQAALDMGLLANDHPLCSQAQQSLGLAHMGNLLVRPAIASWQEALRFAREAGDLTLQMFALTNLPLALNLQGSIHEAETFALEGRNLTQTLQDWSERSKASSHLASLAVVRGNFRAVQRYARETLVMVERSHYPWGGFRALYALAGASAARGLSDEANQALDTLVTPGKVFATPGRIIQVFTRVFRQLILAYGRKPLTEHIASLHDDLMEVVAYDTYSLAPLCAMIELGQVCLMSEFTERPAQMLKAAVDQGIVFASGWGFLIPRSLGVAARLQREWEQGEAYFQQAMTLATRANALPELARTYLDYAYCLAANPGTEDYVPVANLLRQARWLCYEQHMIPHARVASLHLENWFPDINPDDDSEIDRNWEFPPEPPPLINGPADPA
ncbi:hypothetical protein [Candidatus Entotheonella palauensis]|uniref:hypothetical protein n=1 Tax=Candidatus Entotheonella palauensis TaxID=93172 RepID=UPI0015C4B6F9|nr:hypothetical protein [Candidatus Entotheonella palauensis]